MRFAVMGTGAMGGYMAARLSSAGNDVTCIARGRQLEALRERGLRLESPLGDLTIYPIAAEANRLP
jgi:2-dehydropantoate 2-reductase